jgi:hypothetical protein
MMPQGMPQGVQAIPLAMPPHMMGGSPQALNQKVMMMPMPSMPQVAPGMERHSRNPFESAHVAMLPETVGPTVVPMSYPMDPNQCAVRQPGAALGSPYAASHAYPAEQPSFRDVCSPNYQCSEAYERYVKDIMNAEGDDFQFDWPRRQPRGEVMMAENKMRLNESEVSTDEGAWSYASESNSGRWFHSSGLVMSP